VRRRIVALVALLMLAAGCTEADERGERPTPSTEPWRGGTLRVQAWFRALPIFDPPTSLYSEFGQRPAFDRIALVPGSD